MPTLSASLNVSGIVSSLNKIPPKLGAAGKTEVRSQAKSFLLNRIDGGVLNLTPPASQGVRGITARKQGESRILGDIHRVYASRSDAFDDIAKRDRHMAEVFWKLMAEGNWTTAREVLRDFSATLASAGVRDFAPGIHQNLRRRNGRIDRRQTTVLVVADDRPLRDYRRLMIGRVGLLAAGWLKAAAQLGVTAPQWIERHRAVASSWGSVRIHETASSFTIEITNSSRYAGPNNLQRIADYALAYRRSALIRRADYLAKKITREALATGSVLT